MNFQHDLLKGEILILVTFNPLINLVDRSFRAVDMEGLVAVQVGAHDPIESDKVIDMMMRQEYGFQIAEPVVAERGVLSGVDQQRVVAAGIINEQRRVARRAVHQSEFPKRCGPAIAIRSLGVLVILPILRLSRRFGQSRRFRRG